MILPLLIAGGALVAAGIGASAAAANKSAKVDQLPNVNPNDYVWGGTAKRADYDVDRYRQRGDAAQGRTGVVVDTGLQTADRAASEDARNRMLGAASMVERTAMGYGVSPAEAQLQVAQNRNDAAIQGMAASARGSAGIAGAQRNAMSAQAASAGDFAGQAAILRANEQLNAQNALAGIYSGVRQGDLSQYGLAQQGALGQAGLSDAQRGRNDQMQMGYLGAEQNTQQAAMQGRAAAADAQRAVSAANIANDQRDADRWWQLGGSLIGAGGGILGKGVGGGK